MAPRPLGFTIALCLLDPHMQGYGETSISDFEFAASSSRAAQIMAGWGSEGGRLAHLGLLLDYGYMLSYGLFFALAGFKRSAMSRLAAHGEGGDRRWSPLMRKEMAARRT